MVTTVKTFGPARTQIEVEKRRGGKTLSPSCPIDDEPDNPRQVLAFLARWTKPLRPWAAKHPRDRDRIFIGQSDDRTRAMPMVNTAIYHALNAFLANERLPCITFSQIRKGAADAVSRLTSGDRAAKAVALGHKTVATGDMHYADSEDDGRIVEALAQHVAIRDRTRKSGGRVDPRDLTHQDDPMAATPGWSCAAPYEGPPGYRSKTSPCAAYGMCPVCDNGAPIQGSAVACARVFDLRRAILASTDMPEDRWRGVWKPVADCLTEHWIPLLSKDEELVRRASELNLPPLPEVS